MSTHKATDELSELKEVVAGYQTTILNLKLAKNATDEENAGLRAQAVNLQRSIDSLKHLCFQKDMSISQLTGMIRGKEDEQRRVFELENPVIQVRRESLQSPLGYEQASPRNLTYPDWLDVENAVAVKTSRW